MTGLEGDRLRRGQKRTLVTGVAFAFLILAPLLSHLDLLADQVGALSDRIAVELRNVVDPLRAATEAMKDQAPQVQVFLLPSPVQRQEK